MTDITHSKTSKEFIAMMAALMSVVAISIDAMLPALGVIGTALNVSHPNQAQYIISAIFAGMCIGELINGPLSDAVGRKKVLYGGLLIYLIGSLICLNASGIDSMLLGRVVQGLGVSGPYVCCMSVVRDRYSGRSMARIMSLIMMIFIMVPVVAPAIGQGLMTLASWHAIFIFFIVYALTILIWVSRRLPETLPATARTPFRTGTIIRGMRTILTHRQTLCYTLCMGCIFGALIGDLNSAQQIFQEQFGVGEMFVVYFGLQALAFGISSLINAQLVERLGMRYLCHRAALVLAGSSAFFLLLHLLTPIHFWMFFIYGSVLLFCVGMLFGNLNALALEPMGHIAGTASAIISSLSTLVAIPLGTLIGQLYDGTLIPFTAGFALLGLAAYGLMRCADHRLL